jgi:hypothetical protein
MVPDQIMADWIDYSLLENDIPTPDYSPGSLVICMKIRIVGEWSTPVQHFPLKLHTSLSSRICYLLCLFSIPNGNLILFEMWSTKWILAIAL